MLSRGLIIGKLIDDLSTLQSQIELRCHVGLMDLNKYSEDFVKEVLNICYNLKLKNLNTDRINTPGIDLGDSRQGIAYQVTSTITSKKVTETLEKISDDQLQEFKIIRIYLLAKKQTKYDAIDKVQITRTGFSVTEIYDLSDLSRQILTLEFDKLFSLYEKFEREFQIVITEFDIPNERGEYKDSLSKKFEVAPNTKCLTANNFVLQYNDAKLKDIHFEFEKLVKLPRVTREFLQLLVNHGDKDDGNYSIPIYELTRKLKIPEQELNEEISILSSRGFIRELDPDDYPILVATKFNDTLSSIVEFGIAKNELEALLVAVDFTILD